MENFKKELKKTCLRVRWEKLLIDLITTVCWMVVFPAVFIFYVQNFKGVQINQEEVVVYYWTLFTSFGVIIAFIRFIIYMCHKIRNGYVYLLPEEKIFFSWKGFKIYAIVDYEGRGWKVRLDKDVVTNFVAGIVDRANILLEQDNEKKISVKKNQIEECLEQVEEGGSRYMERIIRKKR